MDKLKNIPQIILMLVLAWLGYVFLRWGLIDAVWQGPSERCVSGQGACWFFVIHHFKLFMLGQYPSAASWRIGVIVLILATHLTLLLFKQFHHKQWVYVSLYVFFPVISWVLLKGGFGMLIEVPTHVWGGFLLNVFVGVFVILFAIPLGTLLALARQAQSTLIQTIATCLIETIRGVPMVTLLFLALVVLPYCFPPNTSVDKLIRIVLIMVLFAGSYFAEVIRGGLLAIPNGQYEASKSVGLTRWQAYQYIILPQAFRHAFPSIMNIVIAMVKASTLLSIVGIMDVLAMMNTAIMNAEWSPYYIEGYFFVAMLFWFSCYALSRFSAWYEHQQRLQ